MQLFTSGCAAGCNYTQLAQLALPKGPRGRIQQEEELSHDTNHPPPWERQDTGENGPELYLERPASARVSSFGNFWAPSTPHAISHCPERDVEAPRVAILVSEGLALAQEP